MNEGKRIGRRGHGCELWSADDLSKYLGVPVATLNQCRHRGVGPPAIATYRPDPEANSIAWLIWHLTRSQGRRPPAARKPLTGSH